VAIVFSNTIRCGDGIASIWPRTLRLGFRLAGSAGPEQSIKQYVTVFHNRVALTQANRRPALVNLLSGAQTRIVLAWQIYALMTRFLSTRMLWSLRVVWACGFVLLTIAGSARANQSEEPCVLEVPVYGPTGNKLDFKITGILDEPDSHVTPLPSPANGVKFGAVGNRFFFPKPMLGRSISIRLEDTTHNAVTVKIPLFDCRQRTSARWGFSYSSNADVWALTVKGRLAGCQLSGDWWIRVMPMFGYPAEVNEGVVQPNGSFSLTASLFGERYLLVIGKGREPVKTIGIDVAAGRTNDIGTVDLGGHCPK
jgi:hypothetical protein